MNKSQLEHIFKRNLNRYIEEWKRFLSFPSISADPAHDKDCVDCARWLVKYLRKTGFKARLLKTCAKPVVYAERKGAKNKPAVLFYGHYDVQPVDPLNEWTTAPFKAVLKKGRMYARGTHDNKGQVLSFLQAVETLIKQNALDATVKIIIEGEEESGSIGIDRSLGRWKDFIRAGTLMVADTCMVESGAPTIVMGLRGVEHLTVELIGSRYDLHSGSHGGIAPNPAKEMARLIATLHNPDGSIAVKGFYNSVKPPSRLERKLANAVPFNMKSYIRQTGVPAVAGEKQFTPAERIGFRPTVEINGIVSGYGGPGSKTIIPSRATAKITARIAPGQDPHFCLNAIKKHLEKHSPEGLKLKISGAGVSGPALKLEVKSPLVKKAKSVLDRLMGRKTAFLWDGASIPIVAKLAKVSGAEPLLVGFGMEGDRVHAPNESYSLKQYKLGYLYSAMFLSEK